MKTITVIMCFFLSISLFAKRSVEEIKQELFLEASLYTGQADPNFEIQNKLMPLVEELLSVAPQKEVAGRLNVLDGAWKQIWGAYDYRSDDRSIDPEIVDLSEIYQVVSKDGYYYNVTYSYKNARKKDRIRVTLLRGKYELDKKDSDTLKVSFTKFPGVEPVPDNIDIWDLPALEEKGELKEGRITIVPTFVVRLFFGGGKLKELYTDEDMRITLATSDRDRGGYLYVFKKIK